MLDKECLGKDAPKLVSKSLEFSLTQVQVMEKIYLRRRVIRMSYSVALGYSFPALNSAVSWAAVRPLASISLSVNHVCLQLAYRFIFLKEVVSNCQDSSIIVA